MFRKFVCEGGQSLLTQIKVDLFVNLCPQYLFGEFVPILGINAKLCCFCFLVPTCNNRETVWNVFYTDIVQGPMSDIDCLISQKDVVPIKRVKPQGGATTKWSKLVYQCKHHFLYLLHYVLDLIFFWFSC